jgi:hypothetical protein
MYVCMCESMYYVRMCVYVWMYAYMCVWIDGRIHECMCVVIIVSCLVNVAFSSITHPLTHLLTHSHTPSLTHPFPHSPTPSLPPSLTHPLTHSLTQPYITQTTCGTWAGGRPAAGQAERRACGVGKRLRGYTKAGDRVRVYVVVVQFVMCHIGR